MSVFSFGREVIAKVSISIHELLAVARESEGVKAVQGDAMLCEKRFAPVSYTHLDVYKRQDIELIQKKVLRLDVGLMMC